MPTLEDTPENSVGFNLSRAVSQTEQLSQKHEENSPELAQALRDVVASLRWHILEVKRLEEAARRLERHDDRYTDGLRKRIEELQGALDHRALVNGDLTRKLNHAMTALEWYADPCTYMTWTNHPEHKSRIDSDHGDKASQALKLIRSHEK